MRKKKVIHAEPGGNTSTPGKITPKHAESQCWRWGFTLKATFGDPNDPSIWDPKIIFDNIMPFCKELYYQLEEGEDGKEGDQGYLHYQGCFSLHQKHRMSETKNIIGWNCVHLEKPENWYALKNYCRKEATRVDGPWSHETNWIDTIDIDDFEEWMKEVYCGLHQPVHPRHIYWYWEPDGNVGKSDFVKWCVVHLGATFVDGGSGKDIAHSLPDHPKIILFDFPREMEERIPYGAIERCKNGNVFSPKYESRAKTYNRPHIVCFANFPPEESVMSKDKFKPRFIMPVGEPLPWNRVTNELWFS